MSLCAEREAGVVIRAEDDGGHATSHERHRVGEAPVVHDDHVGELGDELHVRQALEQLGKDVSAEARPVDEHDA
jgi:hypothetical protein